MSSRLFQEVREKRGLVYSIYTFASAYRDGGIFGIYAGTGPGEIVELVPVVCDQLHAIAEQATDVEIKRAAAQIKAGLLMGMESSMSRAEQLGQHILIFDRAIPTREIISRIDGIDRKAIARAATLFTTRPTVAALGPVGKLESFDRIAGRLC
jgi:predicted Zn-dependent peptidase